MTDDLTDHLLEPPAEIPPEWLAWLDADEHEQAGGPVNVLGEQMLPPVPAPAEPWFVTGDHTADWALRKLRAAEREVDRIDGLAEAEVDRVKAWAKKAARRHVRSADFFRDRLREYLRARIEAGEVKLTVRGGGTYELPAGKLTRRAGSESVAVYDEDAFVEWALENRPELLAISPKKAEIKKVLVAKEGVHPDDPESTDDAFTESFTVLVDPDAGEVVPGVAIERGEPVDDAKPSGDA